MREDIETDDDTLNEAILAALMQFADEDEPSADVPSVDEPSVDEPSVDDSDEEWSDDDSDECVLPHVETQEASDDSVCAICQEPITGSLVTIDCGHEFHGACLCNWFRTGCPSCPVCRDNPTMRPEFCMARASIVRRCALRKDAPRALQRLAKSLKDKEIKEKEATRDLRLFMRQQRSTVKTISKLRARVSRTKDAVRSAKIRLGLFHSTELPLPPLRD